MTSYDVAWNMMCYLAAIAVLIGFALYMMAEMREAKEQRRNKAKKEDE
ncbi:hypothetical protein [Pseudomonas savastanoi]|nr:hypothetical protein [Pseudomonas savastanoi]